MSRRHTTEVRIGSKIIGGDHPIAIQSMTNTKTEDVEATVRQILALEEAGCDIVRSTVPTLEAAKALMLELRKRGFRVEVDEQAASLGAKIKDARKERIPYMLVVGEREAAEGTAAVRNRREGELGVMTVDQLAEKMRFEVDNKVV